jgi:hypothetical protein
MGKQKNRLTAAQRRNQRARTSSQGAGSPPEVRPCRRPPSFPSAGPRAAAGWLPGRSDPSSRVGRIRPTLDLRPPQHGSRAGRVWPTLDLRPGVAACPRALCRCTGPRRALCRWSSSVCTRCPRFALVAPCVRRCLPRRPGDCLFFPRPTYLFFPVEFAFSSVTLLQTGFPSHRTTQIPRLHPPLSPSGFEMRSRVAAG